VTQRKTGPTVDYRWHLRSLMAEREMFSTTDLLPLLASRGVVLSREQVYRLVAQVPERLNLTTLAALCDIFECSPAELIEVTASEGQNKRSSSRVRRSGSPDIRPRRARVAGNTSS
jgi:DNA-binding Xre family transcriptional regulator